ncbi:MAG: hypothetical protein IRZ09_02570 [Variibacter sp.]|nr:hypothetical protein [Variibacter sp.]
MNAFLRRGLLLAGLLALPFVSPAPARAGALPVNDTGIHAPTPAATIDVHYRREWRHHRRQVRHWRAARRSWRGVPFVAGRSPYGCYYDEGGGRYVSCSAGGFR